MPYAKHHRKEKERERSKKRKNSYKKKGYNKNSAIAWKKRNMPKKEKHWNWKGGITSLKDSIRNISQYHQWRSNVFCRDNWICQTCNSLGKANLEAHHKKIFNNILTENKIKNIDEAIKFKELWDLSNGVPLCTDCHKLIKLNGGYKNDKKKRL